MSSITSDHIHVIEACFGVICAMSHDITEGTLCKLPIPVPGMHPLLQAREEVHQVSRRDRELPDLAYFS